MPTARWDVDQNLAEPTATHVRHGGFISGCELFDGMVFSISLAEATAMDPQQRLLLEHGYAALHDAALDRTSL